MKCFHQYANLENQQNSIWEIKNHEGALVKLFKDKEEKGVHYFSLLLKELVVPYWENNASPYSSPKSDNGRNE